MRALMVRADNQGRSGGYPTPIDHWDNVAIDLAWTTSDSGRQLAVADVGAQAQDAGRHSVSQQDGPTDLGDADEERELQGSGAESYGMICMSNR